MLARALAGGSVLAIAALLAAGCGTGGISTSGDASRGKSLFGNKCASCHTLADAGALGKVGPNLDDAFASDRQQGFKQSTIEQVVLDQIRFAVLPMPRGLVKGDDAKAVAAYVASVAGLPASGQSTAAAAPPAPATSTEAASTEAASTEAASTEAASTAAASTQAAAPSGGDATKGKALYASLGCQGCHSTSGASGVGPTFKGLAGSQVKLDSGQTVTADDAYLLDSIRDPDKDVVSGFQKGIMSATIQPGSVSVADANDLIAFIKTLK